MRAPDTRDQDHARGHDHDHDRRIADAVSAGRLAILETRPRNGNRARTPVAFAERPDGSLVVAAHDPGAAWARDLRHEPRCRHETRGVIVDDVARELAGTEREAAAVQIASSLGPVPIPRGAPIFELQPIELELDVLPEAGR